MTCRMWKARESGAVSSDAFEAHLGTCDECRRLQEEEDRFMAAVRSLPRPEPPVRVWNAIQAKMETRSAVRPGPGDSRAAALLRAAAVVILVAGAGVWAGMRMAASPPELLPDKTLTRVERLESAYEAAIRDLESRAQEHMETLDTELALLYRDRLETIDTQIARCRDALQENPASTHIRRYMLAALKDKKETLNRMIREKGTSGEPV